MNGLKLAGLGCAAPSRVITNDDMRAYVETSDEWIASRTGIRQRRFAQDDESLLSFASDAARQALRDSGISPDELACVLCATVSWAYAMPSLACLVQAELGLPEDIPAADVNAACSGFLYAAEMARAMMLASGKRYALVIGCETMSRLLNMSERSTCVLFGDGAGAAVLELIPQALYASVLGSRGSTVIEAGNVGCAKLYLHMDGPAVYRFAVDTVPKQLEALLIKAQMTLEDIDWIVCHQANERIIDACIKKLRAPQEKFYKNIAHWGNTSAASIPIALCEMKQNGLLSSGGRIACVGFGAGLSWAALLLTT